MSKRSSAKNTLNTNINRRTLLGTGGAFAATLPLAMSGQSDVVASPALHAPALLQQEKTVTAVHPSILDTLDPNIGVVEVVRSVTGHMYDQIIELTADAQLKPMLAESWRAVNPTTWEFKLRDGVTFHDGTPFDAEVMKFTLERILDPDYNSLQQTFWVPVTNISTPDRLTCVIETETPMGTMPYTMALTTPVHPDVGTDPEAFPDHPIGTGPFQFVEWERDAQVVMEAYGDYWGGAPNLDRVIFRNIPELSTRMSALEVGEIDVSLEIIPEDIERLEATGEIEVMGVDTFRTSFMWMNGGREPFTDVRVRQAIRHAVNMDAIAQSVIEGIGVAAQAPIAPLVFGFNPDLPPQEYNPDRAKELLAEAGYPNGFDTTALGVQERGGYTRAGDVAQVILAQLAEVGINVEPTEPPAGQGLQALLELDWDLYFGGATASTGDADYGMGRLYLCSANRTGWCDEEVDRLLMVGRESTDQDERLDAYKAAQEVLWSDGPTLWTYHHRDTVGVRNRVQGFEARPDRQLLLRNVTVTDGN